MKINLWESNIDEQPYRADTSLNFQGTEFEENVIVFVPHIHIASSREKAAIQF